MVTDKAIFLDRDGIINRAVVLDRKPYAATRLKEVFVVEGIKDLIKRWHDENYLVIVLSNQPDIANHVVSKSKVDKINNYLKSQVLFDDVFVCPHNDKDNCDCRKPKTGLFMQAVQKYPINFSKSYVIGDRWRDIESGNAVGCKTIFVDYDYNEKKPENPDIIVKKVSDIDKIWSFINDKNIRRRG